MISNALAVCFIDDLCRILPYAQGMLHQNIAVGFTLQLGRDPDNDIQQPRHDLGITRAVNANLIEGGAHQLIEVSWRPLFADFRLGRSALAKAGRGPPRHVAMRRAINARQRGERLVNTWRQGVRGDFNQLLKRIQRVLMRRAVPSQTEALAQRLLELVRDARWRQRPQQRRA